MIALIERAGKERRCLMSCVLLSLLTTFALVGCTGVPQTKVSLSEPGETPYDERLIGFWQMNYRFEHSGRDEDGDGDEIKHSIGARHLQVSPREDGLLSVLGVRAKALADEPISWIQADAHASEIDGVIYYNLKLRSVDRQFYSVSEYERLPGIRYVQDLEQLYIILRVNLSDEGKLFIHFMNPYVLARLIEQDQISGRRSSCGQTCSFSVLYASRDELVVLIRELGSEQLFMPIGFGPFHRVKADTKRSTIEEFYQNWKEEGAKHRKAIED